MVSIRRLSIRCIPLLACWALLGACGGSSKGGSSGDGGLPGAGGSDPGQGGTGLPGVGGSTLVGGGAGPGAGGVGGGDGGLLAPGTGGSAVPACGSPGTPCCDGNSCAHGGCCVSGICLSAGGVCVGLGDGVCSAGACGGCGGPGLPCCGANPATGACTAAGTACNAGNCTKCGELGSLCCPSAAGGTGSCNGPNAICSGNVCLACGTPGSVCCSGGQCTSPGCCYDNLCAAEGKACGTSGGTCQAGRCSGCGGVNQACCASSTCYDGLLCKGGTCTPCGGLAQACCPSGSGVPACQAGTACTSSGTDSVCARCGSPGDTCCAGSVCSEGCCSGNRCLAPGSPGCPTGAPDAGTIPDAPLAGAGGAGGAGGVGGQGGAGGVGGNSLPTGGAGGTTTPWTIPVGCGDGVVTPPEQCDDLNTLPFDGCSSDCKLEPRCNGAGPCTSTCGDGLVVGEECDDGNTASGDGCSSTCKVEPGFFCAQPDLGPMIRVPVVYRDFRFQKPTDFEPTVRGVEKASPGMVQSALDSDGKPVFTGLTGTGIHVASIDTFATWYRTSSGINHATAAVLALFDNGAGAYVNHYGANGELWPITETAIWCGNVGTEVLDTNGNPIPCTYKYGTTTIQTDCDKAAARGEQLLKCTNVSGTYQGTFLVNNSDGNPLFFPVDGDDFTPSSERVAAQVPPLYLNGATTWPYDLDDAGNKRLHNFSFTSEIHYWFKFDAGRAFRLDVTGDDDVWVFVNKQLAVDLGGIHTPVQGSVTLDATAATKLGLVDGGVYEVAVFQAERQSTSSTFKLTLSGFNGAPSQCYRN